MKNHSRKVFCSCEVRLFEVVSRSVSLSLSAVFGRRGERLQDDIQVISMWVVGLWSLWKSNVDGSCVLVSLERCNDDAPHASHSDLSLTRREILTERAQVTFQCLVRLWPSLMKFNYVIDVSVVVEIALKTISELRFHVRYIESRKYSGW